MPSALPVYFSSQALRARYIADLEDALAQARISLHQRHWLGLLAEPINTSQNGELPPRVDQILVDDGYAITTELATALLLSDPAAIDATVFLHTLMNALEVFPSREALLQVLNERCKPPHLTRPEWECQRVEADPFEHRMRSIIAHHGQCLRACSDHLLLLPSLQTAVGQALQGALKQALPDTAIDVFSHLLQLVHDPVASDAKAQPGVVGVKTLAESAFDAFAEQPSASDIRRRFLDASGRVLTQVEVKPYSDALDGVRAVLSEVYEQLLERFWADSLAHGESRRHIASCLLADTFGHWLLMGRQARRISPQEFRFLSALHGDHR